MNKSYSIMTQGTSDIFYEDSSCKAKVVAADFRDECWYVGIGEVINLKNHEKCRLTFKQRKVLFQRISKELHQELYTDEFKFINFDESDLIVEKSIGLLEIGE